MRNAAVAAGNARDPPLPLLLTRAQRRAAESTATNGSATMDASVPSREAEAEAEVAELREVVREALARWGGADSVVEEHLQWALERLEG